jgi:hypothetical protein
MSRHVCTNPKCAWENVITTTSRLTDVPGVGMVKEGTTLVTVIDNGSCRDPRKNRAPAHRFTRVLKGPADG